jgi:hypothetical protein
MPLNLPQLCTAADLARFAQPEETHLVRIECNQVQNMQPFVMHGKGTRKFVLTRDTKVNRHVIEIPASVWMADGEAVARDILGKPRPVPLVVLFVPATKPAAAVPRHPAPIPPTSENSIPAEQRAADILEPKTPKPTPRIPKFMQRALAETP